MLVKFDLCQCWLPGAPSLSLTAVYCVSNGSLRMAVTDRSLAGDGSPPLHQYLRWQRQYGLADFVPGRPLPLLPLAITKPWGRELWYTGVEARGQCCFGGNGEGGGAAPIPWVQAALPDAAAGPAGHPLVLLKVLEPLSEAVRGDLYFELHEQKQEVYVVTRIDALAWPEGTGYIRYGFCPELLGSYGSETQFRADFLAAVAAYEEIRRRIDALPAGAVPPADWRASELHLREEMERYSWRRALQAGDVVTIPPLLPHALQHGVRAVEIQTPVYERMILSFAQQVVTQDCWDTAAAVARMRLRAPAQQPVECLSRAEGLAVERVADCPEFEVRRVQLEAGGVLALAVAEEYALLMVVSGQADLGGRRYGEEEAALLPAGWRGRITPAGERLRTVFLLVLPRSSGG